jgi:GntR family transcriptional regulator
VIRVRNLLSLAGAPVIVDDLVLPAVRLPGLTERQFAGRPSTIYNLYQDAFGISVVRTRERLRATLADAAIAALLGVARGAPLLSIRRVALSYNDVPVELRVSLVNTAHHEYWADIGTPG